MDSPKKKKVEKPQDWRQKSGQNIGNPYQMEDNKNPKGAARSAAPLGRRRRRRLVVFHLVRISYVLGGFPGPCWTSTGIRERQNTHTRTPENKRQINVYFLFWVRVWVFFLGPTYTGLHLTTCFLVRNRPKRNRNRTERTEDSCSCSCETDRTDQTESTELPRHRTYRWNATLPVQES